MMLGLIECFVLDETTNVCRIETDQPSLYVNLYWSYNTADYDESNHIGVFSGNDFLFPRITGDQRVYYHLIINDAHKFVTAERILKIDGMYNFRDMGGYPTVDGRRVKWGMLYRGDQLANSKESADAYLKNLNITTIIDLRGKREIEKDPNRCITDTAVTYNFDPNAQIAAFAGEVQTQNLFSSKDHLIATAQTMLAKGHSGQQSMIDQQIAFVKESSPKEAFRNALLVAMDAANAPVFQHCRGGKDRTGYLSMLELLLLGVEEKYVIYDYLLTNKAREEKNQRYREKFFGLTQNEDYTNYYMSLFEARKEYITAALDTIYQQYGDAIRYVTSELDISIAQIQKFRDNYLE